MESLWSYLPQDLIFFQMRYLKGYEIRVFLNDPYIQEKLCNINDEIWHILYQPSKNDKLFFCAEYGYEKFIIRNIHLYEIIYLDMSMCTAYLNQRFNIVEFLIKYIHHFSKDTDTKTIPYGKSLVTQFMNTRGLYPAAALTIPKCRDICKGAIQHGHLSLVRYLFDNGINPDACLLDMIVVHGHLSLIEDLNEFYIKDPIRYQTALYYAKFYEYFDITKYLLSLNTEPLPDDLDFTQGNIHYLKMV